jgi:uncharacterized membrane protein YgcG
MKQLGLLFLALIIGHASFGQKKSADSSAICPFKQTVNKKEIPEPEGWISDYEGFLTAGYEKKMREAIIEVRRANGICIGVLTVRNMKPYKNISTFAYDVFHNWGMNSNGVLVVVSFESKEVKILCGPEAQEKLTEAECSTIISSIMIPEFKRQHAEMGTFKGIMALTEKAK